MDHVSNPGVGEIFRAVLDRPRDPTSLLKIGNSRHWPQHRLAPSSRWSRSVPQLASLPSWNVVGIGYRTYGTGTQNGTRRFPWHAAFTAVPVSFTPLPDQRHYTVNTTCIYTHISDTVQTVHELPSLPNNTAVKHLYTNRSGVKCWLDIYRWGAGLAATGPMRDIGQNVLQASFETGSNSSPVTATFCCLSHSWSRP